MKPIHFLNAQNIQVPVKSHSVVVNKRNGEPVGVVGSGYRLVTNEEAIRYAMDCAVQLFGTDKSAELEVFNVYAPYSAGSCHIDLIHKGFKVNIMKNEVYLPFVRVTNSYNATRALRFDVGYCQIICLNGAIFEAEAIQFKFIHSHKAIQTRLDFRVEKGKLDKLRKMFETNAEKLYDYPIPDGMGVPLFFKALNLPLPKPQEDRSREKQECFESLKNEAIRLIETYFTSLGKNAYAIFSAVTDFASHPPEIKYFRRNQHAMQALAGTWSREFADNISKQEPFDLEAYIGEYVACGLVNEVA
jgi:hypothetical protein